MTLPRHSEREMERFHLLATVVTYPGMSTADVCDRANNECQHDLFDPLPPVNPRAIWPKLRTLQAAGLVDRWRDVDGDRWDPTDAGREAWADYEARLKVIDQPSGVTRHRQAALFVLNDLKDKLAEMELHENLPNEFDRGYMQAWREIKEWANGR